MWVARCKTGFMEAVSIFLVPTMFHPLRFAGPAFFLMMVVWAGGSPALAGRVVNFTEAAAHAVADGKTDNREALNKTLASLRDRDGRAYSRW